MAQSFDYIKHAKPEMVLEEMITGPLTSSHEDLINRLREKGLPDEVVNVLFRFTIPVKDMRVDVIFIENIASTWSKKKINSANYAVEAALEQLKTVLLEEPDKEEKYIPDSSDSTNLHTLIKFAQKSTISNEDIGQLFRDLF
ncbi:DnaD domain protein [Jeotgalibacillus proteolyticus]|uniref:DnaB/C C-terminal domain-containing protein n=1 Tax=Jeotgalibacillus proteolyticus TaxID=2082395 RepID=A0A2S5G890_9BACL|nr:DnaD domain protein [Jeotgalibacillus proteolyticus]PPA69199.1 hypothetical protein C4B60_18015 [Jeotgalibacillus proteolyticus]